MTIASLPRQTVEPVERPPLAELRAAFRAAVVDGKGDALIAYRDWRLAFNDWEAEHARRVQEASAAHEAQKRTYGQLASDGKLIAAWVTERMVGPDGAGYAVDQSKYDAALADWRTRLSGYLGGQEDCSAVAPSREAVALPPLPPITPVLDRSDEPASYSDEVTRALDQAASV
jgi:hypothetical protein